MIYEFILVFIAQFFSVFTLVMNSKLLRDDRWILAMMNSWLISITQFVFILVVSRTDDPVATFFFAATASSFLRRAVFAEEGPAASFEALSSCLANFFCCRA